MSSAKKFTKKRPTSEWVGGRLLMPGYVTAGIPYRPHVVVWVDTSSGQIVASEVLPPDAPVGTAADVLEASLAQLTARDTRPSSIRVTDRELGRLLQDRFDDLEINIAPTPELIEVEDSMKQFFMREQAQDRRASTQSDSYLEEGRVPPATVERFFQAAANLWRAAPWKALVDSELFLLDCPALGALDQAVSIIGNLGECFGVLAFASPEAFHAMGEQAEALDAGEEVDDVGADYFAISYDTREELPPTMLAEATEHGWPVVSTAAYPRVLGIERDRMLRPLTERDILLATVYCEAIAAFFAKHGQAIADESFEHAEETYTFDDLPGTPSVHIVAPHPRASWFEDSPE